MTSLPQNKAKPVVRDRSRPMMRDQSTSTSDPVIEDDHVQVLSLECKKLIAVKLHHVGLTDVIVKDCPKLQSLAGTACRVLKNVTVTHAPNLGRVSFAQCPKLRHNQLVEQVYKQPPEKSRLVFLRPMNDYNEDLLEYQLFTSSACQYHVCLVHDYSHDPAETVHNRIRVSAWPDIIHNINHDLVKNGKVPDAAQQCHAAGETLVRPGVYFTSGSNSNGSRWENLSDFPWLQTLMAKENRKGISYIQSDDEEGVYSPSAKGHCDVRQAVDVLQQDIADIIRARRPLYLHSVIVFVNTCDISGTFRDPYV